MSENSNEHVLAALEVARSGAWTCPGCGWTRVGSPEGSVTCGSCGVYGFDFELASIELPEVATPSPFAPEPCANCPDPCDECTPEEFEAALREAMATRDASA